MTALPRFMFGSFDVKILNSNSQIGTVPISSLSSMLYYCVCNDFVNKEYQHLPADIRYPSETKGQDRPTPSPESGHSAGCSWAPVQVREPPVPARALRVRVPEWDYSVQPQVRRAQQRRWKYCCW